MHELARTRGAQRNVLGLADLADDSRRFRNRSCLEDRAIRTGATGRAGERGGARASEPRCVRDPGNHGGRFEARDELPEPRTRSRSDGRAWARSALPWEPPRASDARAFG